MNKNNPLIESFTRQPEATMLTHATTYRVERKRVVVNHDFLMKCLKFDQTSDNFVKILSKIEETVSATRKK